MSFFVFSCVDFSIFDLLHVLIFFSFCVCVDFFIFSKKFVLIFFLLFVFSFLAFS